MYGCVYPHIIICASQFSYGFNIFQKLEKVPMKTKIEICRTLFIFSPKPLFFAVLGAFFSQYAFFGTFFSQYTTFHKRKKKNKENQKKKIQIKKGGENIGFFFTRLFS